MVIKKMSKEDEEAGQLLHLASTTANFLFNTTVQGFRVKRDTATTDLVTTFMNVVLRRTGLGGFGANWCILLGGSIGKL